MAGFFSFFSNKNLACGEGGMVISNNKELLRKVRLLRSHGMSSVTVDRHAGRAFSYDVEHVGLNYRFDEIRASIALVQLQKLDEGNAKRQKLTEHYRQNLKNTEFSIAFDAAGTNMKPASSHFASHFAKTFVQKKGYAKFGSSRNSIQHTLSFVLIIFFL